MTPLPIKLGRRPTTQPPSSERIGAASKEWKNTAVLAAKRFAAKEVIFSEDAILQTDALDLLSGTATLRWNNLLKLYEKLQAEKVSTGSANPILSNRMEKFKELVLKYTTTCTPSTPPGGHENNTTSGSRLAGSLSATAQDELSSTVSAHQELQEKIPPNNLHMTDTQCRIFWEQCAFTIFTDRHRHWNYLLHAIGFPVFFSLLLAHLLPLLPLPYYLGGFLLPDSAFSSWLHLGFCFVVFFFVIVVQTEKFMVYCTQGVFEFASRINHSCKPNAVVEFSENFFAAEKQDQTQTLAANEHQQISPPTGKRTPTVLQQRITVKALKPILPGEEILIDFLGTYMERFTALEAEARCEILRQDYGVRCLCKLCKAAEPQVLEKIKQYEAARVQNDHDINALQMGQEGQPEPDVPRREVDEESEDD